MKRKIAIIMILCLLHFILTSCVRAPEDGESWSPPDDEMASASNDDPSSDGHKTDIFWTEPYLEEAIARGWLPERYGVSDVLPIGIFADMLYRMSGIYDENGLVILPYINIFEEAEYDELFAVLTAYAGFGEIPVFRENLSEPVTF